MNFLIKYNPQSAKAEEREEYEYIKNDIGSLMDEMKEGLTRISNITKSLKRFSRTDGDYQSSNYDLNRAVQDTLVIAKAQYSGLESIQLEFSEIPLFSCYENDINQVLLNLIINSLQALSGMPLEHKGYLKIKTGRKNNFIELTIEDNGSGIPPNIKNKIFDPFFTTKEIGSGTGLGLSLCFSIITRKHGGGSWLDSRENPTRFIINLPIDYLKGKSDG